MLHEHRVGEVRVMHARRLVTGNCHHYIAGYPQIGPLRDAGSSEAMRRDAAILKPGFPQRLVKGAADVVYRPAVFFGEYKLF
jgi:hypothetical protein